jgi:hypothetical protein
MMWRPSLIGMALALGVCLGLHGGVARAEPGQPRGNLIPNAEPEGEQGSAPKGMFHGINYDKSVGKARMFGGEGALAVNYRYGKTTDGRPYADVELVNRAAYAANYTLYLTTQRVVVNEGAAYSLKASIGASGVNQPVVLALGFQFYKPDGNYLSDMAPESGEFRSWHLQPQQLSAEYVGGAPEPSSGQVPASFYPRVSVYNLGPDATMKFRLTGVSLIGGVSVEGAAAGGVKVHALKRPIPDMAPGQVLPLTVRLSGRPNAKALQTRLTLQPIQTAAPTAPAAKSWSFDAEQPLKLAHWGEFLDVWALRLPASLPAGDYVVWHEIPSVGGKTKLGTLKVKQDAGMWLGQAIHRYPGSSETTIGPLLGKYQFVRSLASDYAHRMQWWLAPDEYDWKGLTKWAQFHAKPGERKLVFTFSGSPRWASSDPNQPAAMGVPGNAAPPAPEYRKAYQRMVKDTVTRFKDRILASECWNEPNSPDFYTGTKTELADLCKAVYEATKAVDRRIMVICPQADDPSHLDAVYSAKTSAGEPIHQFCDVVGSHIYNRMGIDRQGRDYARQKLWDALEDMVAMSRKYGIDKPLAVTEYGLNSCVLRPTPSYPRVFHRMSSQEASEAIYRAMAGFREFGVLLVGLYSYDHPDNDPKCRPGGSFMRMTYIDKWGDMKIDPVMADRVSDAVVDFGRAGGD